jgi:hypothetical protein
VIADPWPDEALDDQARSIGPALLRLIDSESRWVHRRVERLELLNATQLTRSVATDLTVPVAEQLELGLLQQESDRDTKTASRFVLPLGVLPKGALQDFTITPADAHRLTADQTSPLIVAALTPYARRCGAPASEVLSLAREIIRRETPDAEMLARFEQLLRGGAGDSDARERLLRLITTLNDCYILLVAVKTEPGMPIRVTYMHRQVVAARTGPVTDPPLIIEPLLPYASGPGPSYRVEVVAPEGMEVETASIVSIEGAVRRPRESVNTEPGGGAFVQLRAPDSADRPRVAGLRVVFGWPSGGVHHLGTIAGSASTGALLVATLMSYWLGTDMQGSSAGTLLAAPALVTSLALGFATTRVTSAAVNRLRIAALVVALLGVTGALAVSLLAEKAARLDELHGTLIACTVLSALVTFGFAGRAALRERERVPSASEA